MSLYLKYRPNTLENMVGQRHILDILLAQAQQGKFSSSYLLYGPRGTGKTSTARLLAKMVNCTTLDANGSPDLENDPCVEIIDTGKTLDFVEIDAASHTGVDNIREEIIDKALYPPTTLKTKVYVIDEVHMLSKGAFNALLKIMEEAGNTHLMFILATTEINKVPDTIISRCQVFNFKHLSVDEIAGRLENIATAESIQFEPEALKLIAKLSNGALRDGIKYLEQVSILGSVSQEHVAQFLGVVPETILKEFMGAVIKKDYNAIQTQLNDFLSGGTDLYALLKDILGFCDDQFMNDPDTYSVLVGMFQEIAAEMKWYPHPVLVRKRKLWSRCGESDKKKVDKELALEEKEKTPKEESNGTPISEASSAIETESAPVVTDRIKEKTDAGTKDVSNNDNSEEKLVENSYAGDLSELLEKIIARVEKVMVKSVLKQQTIVDSFDNGILSLLVINEQFYETMKKAETVEYLQSIVKELTGNEVTIKRTYVSKEDMMKRTLAG